MMAHLGLEPFAFNAASLTQLKNRFPDISRISTLLRRINRQLVVAATQKLQMSKSPANIDTANQC
jgi:hypothetical protein